LVGGAAVLATGAVGAALARRSGSVAARAVPGPTGPPPPARTELAPADPLALAVSRMSAEPDVARGTAEAYRRARRAFNAVRADGTDEALTELRDATLELWAAAACAEPFSPTEGKAVARAARELLGVLDEHRDLGRLAAAASAEEVRGMTHAVREQSFRRRARLERRLTERGKRLFASKPARIAGRIADDRRR
jgi:hypothetical protein